jgi:Zn-finger nucleic acid-binding protein
MGKIACPACKKVPLDVITDSKTGLELDTCPTCLGVWFDAAELKDFYSSEDLKKRLTPTGGGSVHHTYEVSSQARRCPRCRKGMERPHVGGIALDVCRHCRGVWFDNGELRKITEIHKSRGLKGDEIVTDQVREGMRGKGKGGGGTIEVLSWFLNSFLSTKLR